MAEGDAADDLGGTRPIGQPAVVDSPTRADELSRQATRAPSSVLFMCSLNSVRSPMGSGLLRHIAGKRMYVRSAGVRAGEIDGFVIAVMDELGIDVTTHVPHTLTELDDDSFDLIITLSPEAHHHALEFSSSLAIDVEYWPTADPSAVHGRRDEMLDAYRACREGLFQRIRARFPNPVASVG